MVSNVSLLGMTHLLVSEAHPGKLLWYGMPTEEPGRVNTANKSNSLRVNKICVLVNFLLFHLQISSTEFGTELISRNKVS